MVSVLKCALTITIIASIACSVFALQCYHCESTQDAHCGENFEAQERYKVDCDRLQQQRPQQTQYFGPFIIANATACVRRFYNYLPGQPRIQRTCFYGAFRSKQMVGGCSTDPNTPSEHAYLCDICQDDYCNGSITLKSTGLAAVLLLVMMRLFA